MSIRLAAGACLATIAVCLASPVYAQSAAGAEADETATSGVADIVVTAQKRSERMQSVPVAVSAFSGDTLAAKGVRSITDLARSRPGW